MPAKIRERMKDLLFGIAVAVLVSGVHAADVRILAWDDEVAARRLAWMQGEEAESISDLHSLKRSKAYAGPAEGTPVLIRAVDRPAPEGRPAAELQCSVGADIRRPLLLLLPDPKAPSGLRGLVVEDDPTSFGWGTMRFFNTTGEGLVVQCDKTAVRVPAGWKPVDINPGGRPRNVGIRIALAKSMDVPAYSSVWDHRDDTRSLVFILRGGDARLGSLTLKAVPEAKGVEENSDAKPQG